MSYKLTEREAKLIGDLMHNREHIEEAIRNALTMIAACRELEGQQRLMTIPGGGYELIPVEQQQPITIRKEA